MYHVDYELKDKEMSVKGRSTGKGKVTQSCPGSSVQKTDIAAILLQYQQVCKVLS